MFKLVSASAIGLASIRLKFSTEPRATNPDSFDDALNPLNYAVTGEGRNFVTSVLGVDLDPLSFDLSLVAPLTPGTWTVAVANVLQLNGDALSAPTSLTVPVSSTMVQAALSGGAVNDDVVNVLRKFLNPGLRGQGWDSLLAALAVGDRLNWNNAKLAFDQLFLSSASGIYLERRAGDQGIKKPEGVMMSDELFSKLSIILATEKLTQEAILEVLEVFYGSDALRASTVTDVNEPYALEDGSDLQILVDGRESITVTFNRAEFADIGAALAVEVAAAITRAMRAAGSQGFSFAVVDPTTGESTVRVYSGRLGIASSVQIVGGLAQTVLLFPHSIFEESGSNPFAEWIVSLSPTTLGNIRFEMVAGGIFDLSLVRQGDLAYIFGGEFEATNNTGVFTIQDVNFYYDGVTPVQWFEITNPAGSADSSILQTEFKDLMFFRPEVRTIYNNPRRVIVAQVGDAIDIVIPATTQAVSRYPGIAAYGQVADALEVTSMIRGGAGVVEVETAEAHGLAVGDHVIVDGAVPTFAQPATTAGTPSGAYSSDIATGTTDASLKSTASETGTFQGFNHKVLRLPEGMLMVVGGHTQASSGTPAVLTAPVIFEITGETTLADGSRQQTYKWTDNVARTYHTGHRDIAACVLVDGRVLVSGGRNGTAGPTANATLNWDLFTYTNSPPANSQTNGSMPIQRAGHGMVALLDGRALVCGGNQTTLNSPSRDDTFIFDQVSLTWNTVDSMNDTRRYHGLVTLLDGSVLAMGGISIFNVTNSSEVYDPNADSPEWLKVGIMSTARHSFASIVIPDGRVVVIGGTGCNITQSSTPVALASCEIYDPGTGLWSPLPSMAVARANPVAAYNAAKHAIVVAGNSSKIEILDLATMKWSSSMATIATPLDFSAGAVAGDDTFVVIGGNNGTDTLTKNYPVIFGQDTFRGGRLNGEARIVSVPSATEFTFDTSASGVLAYTETAEGVTVTPVAAPTSPAGIPGPYSFETKTGFSVTAVEATVTTALNQDQQYRSVLVDDTSEFPDAPGYLLFNFGRTGVVAPVKYLGRISNTELALDAGFRFTSDVAAGTKVVLLSGRGPFQPPRDTHPGSFYLTGSAAGRVAAEAALVDTIGAGLVINKTIDYPGDRGLGNEGNPSKGSSKLGDRVSIWGGDDLDAEVEAARTQS